MTMGGEAIVIPAKAQQKKRSNHGEHGEHGEKENRKDIEPQTPSPT
jgi:hypothetical protein